jgi:hypothetical protein
MTKNVPKFTGSVDPYIPEVVQTVSMLNTKGKQSTEWDNELFESIRHSVVLGFSSWWMWPITGERQLHAYPVGFCEPSPPTQPVCSWSLARSCFYNLSS